MTLSDTTSENPIDRLAADLRPKLHRYCARMTGSVFDGEDVVQDALLKAVEASRRNGPIDNPEAWLFRIAHNAALDFLRRKARQAIETQDEALEMIADPIDEAARREAAAASLRTFMRLPVAERAGVILMDVLGYSLREVAEVTAATIPAVKAALHRGRERLRDFAARPEEAPPREMTARDRALLSAYIDRFNARDFDAIRRMLADDIRLDVLGRASLRGRAEVGRYFGNYAALDDWRLSLGLVDGRPAVLVCRPGAPQERPRYLVRVDFEGQGITRITDYRYAAHVIAEAEIIRVDQAVAP